jgi:hypothetical protein
MDPVLAEAFADILIAQTVELEKECIREEKARARAKKVPRFTSEERETLDTAAQILARAHPPRDDEVGRACEHYRGVGRQLRALLDNGEGQ